MRKVGRKMYGKYVGTTLLTKGLEFDTVIILEAEKFPDPKNLYVAISRCSKRLIVLAQNSKLSPYPPAAG
jgi:DNA helicase-2/ATP-dependent DNA helicase PcrA